MIGFTQQAPGNTAEAVRPQRRSIIPPHIVVRDFLEESVVRELIDLAVMNEAAFRPSEVYGGGVKPSVRQSVTIGDLRDFGSILKAKVRDLAPTLMAELGMQPVTAPIVEFQFAAHGDGDFFERHSDTLPEDRRIAAGTPDTHRVRLASMIYYFHTQPKAFTGGALRLFAIGDPLGESFVDIEPPYNGLVVFPAWAPHGVMPVSCPSKRFIDSRFAANLFVCDRRPAKSSTAEAR